MPALPRLRRRVPAALLLLVAGCGGDASSTNSSTGSSLDVVASSEFNGTPGTLDADPEREIGRNRTTLAMESGARKFVFGLNVDTMRKGQDLDLATDAADATYSEGGKLWIATAGRVRVISELGKTYLVEIEDADFRPKDESGEALGTFRANGTLRR